MRSVVLGVDTSCYTTSVAAVSLEDECVANLRIPLSVSQGERGLQQSKALFQHTHNLPILTEQLFSCLGDARISAVSASTAPRPVEGSYMPVFLAGHGLARSLSAAMGVPLFETSHQQGHIAAGLYQSGLQEDDFLAFHVSGGTTELTRVHGGGASIELLGGTQDLHGGQLIDRVGVAMGCSFPAGAQLDELAAKGQASSRLPASVQGLQCHLSGAEAQAMRWIKEGMEKADIAAEIFDFMARTMAKLIQGGISQTGLRKVLLVGGVMSSLNLRKAISMRLQKKGVRFKLYTAQPGLSADNAVGVARIGLQALREG